MGYTTSQYRYTSVKQLKIATIAFTIVFGFFALALLVFFSIAFGLFGENPTYYEVKNYFYPSTIYSSYELDSYENKFYLKNGALESDFYDYSSSSWYNDGGYCIVFECDSKSNARDLVKAVLDYYENDSDVYVYRIGTIVCYGSESQVTKFYSLKIT